MRLQKRLDSRSHLVIARALRAKELGSLCGVFRLDDSQKDGLLATRVDWHELPSTDPSNHATCMTQRVEKSRNISRNSVLKSVALPPATSRSCRNQARAQVQFWANPRSRVHNEYTGVEVWS
jgi:hypothetical protein